MNLAGLRRFAVARTFRPAASVAEALEQLSFVQADPIRAPARAQDLTLRHRVEGYRSGDLDAAYATLPAEEDFFVNYGFLHRPVSRLMHPRMTRTQATRAKRTRDLLAFVRDRGEVHPREAQAHFAHGTVTNYWGGSSNATTHLLDAMHYRGLLRITRREAGIRVYGVRDPMPPPTDASERRARLDALVDVAIRTYAPVPSATLAWLVNRFRYGVPQWRRDLPAALVRAKARLARVRVGTVNWYWLPDEPVDAGEPPDTVRLLAPFDPLVWDRRRFELFWEWPYRFEAYTPAPKRRFGYYALPVLWRDRMVGWANVSLETTPARVEFGYADVQTRKDRAFRHEAEAEVARLRTFLEGFTRGAAS